MIKNNISKLGLGTVQFGRAYGLKNNIIKKQVEINKILDLLKKNNVSILDTSSNYLDSEKKIGNYKNNSFFKIITKTAYTDSKTISKSEIKLIDEHFHNSLKNIRQKNIYALLIHSFEDILKPGGNNIINLLKKYKDKGYVKKIGVSIYNPTQFYKTLDIFEPDIVQFPLNILDQRFLNINFSLFKKRIEFHARSIFLQGLLLNDIKKLPRFFFPIKKKLGEIHNFFIKMEVSMLEACICFAIQQKKINHFIIGVDKYVQIKNIITTFKKKKIRKIDFSQFSMNQDKFIDPRNWKKL